MRPVIINPLCPHEKEKKKRHQRRFWTSSWRLKDQSELLFESKQKPGVLQSNPTTYLMTYTAPFEKGKELFKSIPRRDDDLQRGNRLKSQFNSLLCMDRKERTQVIWLLTRSSFYLSTLFSWAEIIILTFLIPSDIVSLMPQRSIESNLMINSNL